MSAAAATVLCSHCGTPFRPTPNRPEFCCAGCQFVSHLLHKRGLEEFYNYGEKNSPTGNFVFHGRDVSWLREVVAAAERAGGEVSSATLDIQGISCAGCVWLLERVFLEHPGAIACRVNSSTGTLRLEWATGQCDLAAYASDVHRFGYLLGPADISAAKRPLARKLGLCGALAMNAMLFALPRYLGLNPGDELSRLFDVISLGIATASLVIGGGYFFRRAAAALRARSLHIDLPIALGLGIAYAGSCIAWASGTHSFAYLDFVSIFTFLMLLGRWLQERAVENNRRRLLAMRLSPGRVQTGGEWIAAESVVEGQTFILPKGSILPTRSRLAAERALFALNWITGEPAPREFRRGSIVPAGARCLAEDGVTCESLESWEQSHLASLLAVESGMAWRNAGMQRLIRSYLGIVLTTAAIGFAAWGLSSGNWILATQVLVSVLVVSCPCAIGVALPLLDDLAAARMQRSGIYVREGSLWERLPHVQNILFDKTGTITLETLSLTNPESLEALTAAEKSALLRIVQSSLHPVAACLRETLLPLGIEPADDQAQALEVAGFGLEWKSAGATWRLGRPEWAGSRSHTRTALTRDGCELAGFSFREEVRPGAGDEVDELRRAGLNIFLLSGDDPGRVGRMAADLGLPSSQAFGGLTPEGKADLVTSRWSGSALMIGDGANDSLAFDAALCRGTPSVDSGLLEHKADFYMPGTALGGLGDLIRASRRHRLTARAVFAFAIAYNASAVAAALAGWMNPLVAAIIMPLSSLASIAIVIFGFQTTHPTYANNQP